MTFPLACTRTGCSGPAVRALLNSFGYVHLECARHLGLYEGSPAADVSRLLRASPESRAALRAAGRRPADVPDGSDIVEVPLGDVLALSVMEG